MRIDARNLVIAGLASAVIGLGTVVAVDHTAGSAGAGHQSAALTASNTGTTGATPSPHHGYALAGGALKQLGDLVMHDTGLTPQQLFAGVRAGKSLDELVGSTKAAQLKADLVAELKTELDKAVSKNAISSADETRLLNDAGDVIDVVMSAHLGTLFPTH